MALTARVYVLELTIYCGLAHPLYLSAGVRHGALAGTDGGSGRYGLPAGDLRTGTSRSSFNLPGLHCNALVHVAKMTCIFACGQRTSRF